MLAYRHIFHAGNFADVFKHALLARLLIALGKKDKPYCYLDTHAGIGRYDLTHAWAQKAREYETGARQTQQVIKRSNHNRQPECSAATPPVIGLNDTRRKPAASIIRANTFGLGNLLIDSTRY